MLLYAYIKSNDLTHSSYTCKHILFSHKLNSKIISLILHFPRTLHGLLHQGKSCIKLYIVIHSKDAFHHLKVQIAHSWMIKNKKSCFLKKPKRCINSSKYKQSPFLCFVSAALTANSAPHGHLNKTPRPERQRKVHAACWVSGRTSSAPGYKWICYSSHFHTCALQICILSF